LSGHVRGSIEDVLTVVEDDQRRLVAGRVHERTEVGITELAGDRLGDAVFPVDPGEVDLDGPVLEVRSDDDGVLAGEARLADPARTGDRDQPSVAYAADHIGHLCLTTDQIHPHIVRNFLTPFL
jgi:hypothetical protein